MRTAVVDRACAHDYARCAKFERRKFFAHIARLHLAYGFHDSYVLCLNRIVAILCTLFSRYVQRCSHDN